MAPTEVDEAAGVTSLLAAGVLTLAAGLWEWVVVLLAEGEAVPFVTAGAAGPVVEEAEERVGAAVGRERLEEEELELLVGVAVEVVMDWLLLDLRVEPTSLRKRLFIGRTCSGSNDQGGRGGVWTEAGERSGSVERGGGQDEIARAQGDGRGEWTAAERQTEEAEGVWLDGAGQKKLRLDEVKRSPARLLGLGVASFS